MNSNKQKISLLGCCIIYCCFAVIIFTVGISLMIRSSLEAQGELLFLRDIINYIIGPLTFLSLIIAPVIGASIVVYQTKEILIGIRSIKYFFIPILLLNLYILLDSLIKVLFFPASTSMGRFIQAFGVVLFVFLLILILLSRFISIILVTSLMRKNSYFTVRDDSE